MVAGKGRGRLDPSRVYPGGQFLFLEADRLLAELVMGDTSLARPQVEGLLLDAENLRGLSDREKLFHRRALFQADWVGQRSSTRTPQARATAFRTAGVRRFPAITLLTVAGVKRTRFAISAWLTPFWSSRILI